MRVPSSFLQQTLLSVLLVATGAHVAQAQHNHASGLPHNIPDFCAGSSDNVAAGSTMTLSGSQSKGCLGIHGTVVLTGSLTVTTIMVYEGGFLDVRSGASITFRNAALDASTDPEQYGTGMLVFGRLRMAGVEKTPFVRVARAPMAGQATLLLASAPSGWSVGDEVFIPDTRQVPVDDWFNSGYGLRHEYRTITGISGSSITLNAPLTYDHRGARDANGAETVLADGTRLLPHVANLSRSIVVRSADPNGTRGHVLVTSRAVLELRGVLFRDLGRTRAATLDSTTFDSFGNVTHRGTNQVGRYPLHIHHLWGPVNPTNTGYQFQILNNVIRDAQKWPMAIHASHYGLIQDNVVIGGSRLTGAGISLEDGSETENLVRRNFVADVRGNINPRQSGSDTTTPGSGGECIWTAGFNNRFIGNVVTGCRNTFQQIVSGVGFKFFTPAAPSSSAVRNPLFRGADMHDTAQTRSVIAQRQRILQFDDNEAYGLMADGLTIWNLGTDGYEFYPDQPETVLRDLRVWNAYEGAVWLYPANRLTIEDLVHRYDPSVTPYDPPAITSGDYRLVNLTVRRGDMHSGAVIAGTMDPIGTFRFEDVTATTKGHAFTFPTPATPGTQATRGSLGITMVIVRPRIKAWPGQPLKTIAMRHDTSKSPYNTTNPYLVQVTDDQAIPGNSFRAYFAVQASQTLYGGRAPCTDTTSRPEVFGITCGGAPPPPPPPSGGEPTQPAPEEPTPPPPPPPPPPSVAPPPSTGDWAFCANEDQRCAFSGTRTVRYGANGAFVTKSLTGGTDCTNAVFGDPLIGVRKHCDLAALAEPTEPTGPTGPTAPSGGSGGSNTAWTPGDADGDGKADLTLFRTSNRTWYMLHSSQGYASGAATEWGSPGDIPVAGDYDGDRKLDVAVFRPSNGTWYIRTSTSNFMATLSLQHGAAGDAPVPADFDGDGRTDVAVFRRSTGRWYVLGSRSNFTSASSDSWGTNGDIAAPADFDGDGKADRAVFRPSTRTWLIEKSSGGTSNYTFGSSSDIPVPADYDGDGKADLAAYRGASGTWYVRTSSSRYGTELRRSSGRSGDVPLAVDQNGDGKTDFVAYQPATSSWYVLLSNASSGSPSLLKKWGSPGDVPVPCQVTRPNEAGVVCPIAGSYTSARTGDFDGDFRSDLTLFRPSTGTWYIAWAATSYRTGTTKTFGTKGDIPLSGDFDGDRRMDLAVYRPSQGRWMVATSSSDFGSSLNVQHGDSSDVPQPADFDGDGRTDMAVFRPSNGRWYVRTSSSNFSKTTEVAFGTKHDVPVAADYDGDGVADYAVFRPSARTWFILKSTTSESQSYRFGNRGDILVPADYDGDGKADLALYSTTLSAWYLLTSDSNYRTEVFRGSGRRGDVPVLMDRDGDGATDFVAFHTLTVGWYALTRNVPFDTGTLISRWGEKDDIPVPVFAP